MQVILNGQSSDCPPEATVATLIELSRLGGRRLAVELNGDIVPRSVWPETRLHEGDRLELVHAIGGG